MPEDRNHRPLDDTPPVPPVVEEDDGDDGTGDASDLLGGLAEEPNDVDALDDRTGEGDEIEDLEDDLGGEDGWTDDSEADDAAEEEDLGAGTNEYGWTDDSEPTSSDDWDDDLVPGDENGDDAADADSGEEGVDAEVDTGDDVDPDVYRPLDADVDLDLDVETDATDEDDDVDGLGFETEDGAWELPPPVDPSAVLVSHLGPSDQGLTSVAALGVGVYAAGGDGFATDGDRLRRIDDAMLDAAEVETVAVLPGADGTVVAFGSVLAGCLVRRRATGPFAAANGWCGDRPRTSFSVYAQGRVLFGRTGEGALHRSDDAGERWTRVDAGGRCLAVASGERRLVALVEPADKTLQLAWSDDDGASFARRPLPLDRGMGVGPDVTLSVAGAAALVAAEELGAPLYTEDSGRTFRRFASGPTTIAAALDPNAPDTAYLALFRAAEDAGALAMTADGGRTFVTLFEMRQLRRVFRLEDHGDPEGENRITAIALDPGAPGKIYLASGAGAFVVAVRSSGRSA